MSYLNGPNGAPVQKPAAQERQHEQEHVLTPHHYTEEKIARVKGPPKKRRPVILHNVQVKYEWG